MPTYAHLSAIACHLPSATLDNHQLARAFSDWSAQKIADKTGIVQRHIAAADETAADLACHAAHKLFDAGQARRGDIDFLILCTQTPDYLLPTSACILQHRLGLPTSCGALDINLGCSGYVYGLAMAKGLIEAGIRRNVLLLTADTYSKLINPLDRSVRTLFGDGAAATLVSAAAAPDPHGSAALGPFVLGSDGSGANHLMVPAGGMRTARSAATAVDSIDASGNLRSLNDLFMDGAEIMQFTLSSVPRVMRELLETSGKTLDDIDHVIFHQANQFMLEALRKKLKIPAEKFIVELDTVGNTVSSTIPIAIDRARDKGRIRPGDTALLLGFGVGYSWGGTLATLF
ncbi:ketoacyl-ACP synthase III [Janthinobacterium agaricidamnosum]|uniref:3-oxoacyl-(Acyl-carrier-protein) synthase III n=1 Tax=Janthinobacterium agaricidamnosum NBRC 102515 = DSM 9628 TaxID=1349767 RepID=W0V3X7_9BURK|nr:ketoacyl-ACP synthase III [Janthinobacterium agaricidamnosum]CDG82581.1 3-oxoacyl-(Acyl-carrier-protein) synthase III [Janthinobacterium agaricidamnosum NBRC 102515 = DSM 9628]